MKLEEFLTWEERQEARFEFVDGVPRMMVGGTQAHDRISGNIFYALRSALRGSRCRATTSDLKVVIPNGNVRYPDVMVDCGPFQPQEARAGEPTVIVEVISKSTAYYDQHQKMAEYLAIDSVQHYLLVWQDRPKAEMWSRRDRQWVHDIFDGLDATIGLSAVGIALEMREMYEGIEFDDSPRLGPR